MTEPGPSSKMAGGPAISTPPGKVVVVQRKLIGWGLLAFGLGMPAAVLVSDPRFRRNPQAYLVAALEGLGRTATLAIALAGLFFLSLALYGLFWLLWTRELVVDLNAKRLRFRTGLWPRLRTVEAGTGEIKTIHLWRKVAYTQAIDAVAPGGDPLESWEVRLDLPGGVEPLFLGEWGERREAREEIERWRAIVPGLTVEERDPAPDVPRAPN